MSDWLLGSTLRIPREAAQGPSANPTSLLPATPIWRNRPIRYLVLCGALLIAAIAIGTTIMVLNSRDRALADSERELKNTALILAEQVERNFQAIELIQASIIERIQSLGISSSEDFERRMSSPEMHQILKDKISGLPYIDAVTLISADGKLINLSRFWPVPANNISDRDRFIALKSNPQLKTYIGEPVHNRTTGTWTIHHARRLTAPNGDFLGLVQGAILLKHFEQLFGSIMLGEAAAIAMFRLDGTLLARFPRIEAMIGRNFSQGPLFRELLSHTDRGTLRLNSRIDGQDRLVFAHTLKNYPIGVVAATTMAAALADWREQTRVLIGMAVLSIFLIGAILAMIVRQVAQGQQWSKRRLALEKQRLDSTINNMSQGLLMFDPSERIVVCNRRYIEMYGLSPDVVKPGCRFRDLISHRKATGSFSGDVDKYCSDIVSDLAHGKPCEVIVQTTDGRSVRILNQPVASGGWVATHEDVTERQQMLQAQHKAEELLRQQKLQLDAALNNMVQGLCMFDGDGRIVLFNQRYVDMMGFPAEELTGLSLLELCKRRDAKQQFIGEPERFVADILAGMRAGVPATKIVESPNGRALRAVDQPMADGGWVATFEDITEQRKIERERDQDRAFLNQIVDNVPVMIAVKDAASRRFVLVNRAAELLWGISRKEALGKTARELFPQAQADLIDKYDIEALRSDSPLVLDPHPNMARSGDKRIVSSKRLAIRADDGAPTFLVSVVEDVTERRRGEEERNQNREFINQIIDNVPVAIIVKNVSDRRVAYINRATEELWGISRTAAIGHTASELFPKDLADIITKDDEKALASTTPLVRDEHSNRAKTGDSRILVSKKLVVRSPDGTPKYLISVIEDVSERKAIEAQLRQSQKMEAIGNLTGGVAHDFNNLLTVMIGNLDLLVEESAERPQTAQRAEAVLDAALRGAELTKQMLAFSRRQALQPKCVDLNKLIGKTTRLLARTLGEGIRIDVRKSPMPCPIMVDEAQLDSALVNVAINARDAMPDGGTLTIAAGNVFLDDAAVANRPGLAPGEHVVLKIADTGTGMSPEVLGHIFEPFFTTKDTGKGTGLGLSMVYGFVKQSGGHIGVTSAPDGGTTFELCFPAVSAAGLDVDATTARDAGDKLLGTGAVVLAVDDQPVVRATAVAHLKSLGYQVIEADCAKTALTKLAAGAKVDLLFTDIVMPGGINGIELARIARAERPDLKVLYTSGYPGAGLVDGAEVNVDGTLLTKPYRKQDLVAAITAVMADEGRFISP